MTPTSRGLFSRVCSALLALVAGATVCSAQVDYTVGTLAPGQSVTFTYDVTINETLSPGTTTELSHQAAVSYDSGATALTDDPETNASNDATVTPLTITATRFGVTTPANATAGSSVTVSVTAYDDFGNVATGYAGSFAFTSSDALATLPSSGATLTNGTGAFSVTFGTAGSHTVTATDSGNLLIGDSAAVTVGSAAATHFTVVAAANATAGDAVTYTVTARDAYENIATGYAGTVTFTSTDGAAVLPVNASLTNGTGSFSVTFKTSGVRTVTATDTVASSIAGSSGSVTVAPAAATHFIVSAPANALAGVAGTFTVTARDAFENTATTYAGTVQFTSSDGAATLASASTLVNGSGSFSATFATAGTQTVTATDSLTSSITGTSSAVAVEPAAAARFAVAVPGSATAGSAVSITVTALDAFGNTATGYAGSFAFTSSDAAATLPSSGATLTSGTGAFNVTFKTAGGHSVTATDGTNSLVGESVTVTVVPSAATHFTVVGAGASTTAGDALAFTVTARDAYTNVATGYTGTVTFTSTDGAAVLPANTSLTNGAGSVSVTLKTSGVRTVTASDTVTPSITGASGDVTVSPAAATHFVVSAPADAVAGVAGTFTVTARDAFENTATGYAGTVQFTSSDGAATLASASALVNGSGSFSATFATAGSQTVTATDSLSSSVTGTSSAVVVAPAAAVRLAVTAPGTSTAGSVVSFTVTALDAFGNTATGYGGTVTFASDDSAAVLPADAALAAGTAIFSATLKTTGVHSLTATDTVTSSITGTSGSVDVSAATATHFTVSGPANATAGDEISVSVVARDAFDNIATDYTGSVSLTSSDSAAIVSGDATLVGGSGAFTATFKTAGTHTVTATDTVASSITGESASISVAPAVATHFVLSVPATATAGTPITVTVTAMDAFENPATAYAAGVLFTSDDAVADLPSDAALTGGTGSFSVMLKTAGTCTVTVTDSSAPAITGTSAGVVVSPAPAATLRVETPVNATAGEAFTVTVTALDAYGNTDTAYAGAVSIESSDTLAVLPGASTLANGSGAFSVTLKTEADQTVSATGPHATSGSVTGTSPTIAVASASAMVVLSDLEHVYDGTPKTAAATTTPDGLLVTFAYDGVPLALSTTGDLSAYASAVNRTIAVRVTGRTDGAVVGGDGGIYAIQSDLATAAVHAGVLADGEAKVLSVALLADTGAYTGGTQNGVTSQSGGAALASFSILGEASGSYLAEAPVDAGSYDVTATIVDPSYRGSASDILVILPAGLTITGVTASDKTYDGTTAATLDMSAATLVGVVSGDDVQIDASGATATFASADAGTDKSVTAAGIALSGVSVSNYTLAQPAGLAADILKAAATVVLGNLTHTYDGTAKSVSVTTSPAGLATVVTYAGGSNAPSAVGTYSVVATIDETNYEGAASGTLTIVYGNPTIVDEPEDQTVKTGGAVTLTVSASSETAVSYQWYFEGQPIDGATSATLTLTEIRRSQAGKYSVVITNSAGSVSSAVVTVTVEPAAYAGTYFGRLENRSANLRVAAKRSRVTVSAATDLTAGNLALSVRDDGSAVLLAYLPETQTSYRANVTLDQDGVFSGASIDLATGEPGPVFSGRIVNGVLTGTADGVALTLAAEISPVMSAEPAGYYETVAVGTVQISTYTIVGSDGEVLAVTVTSGQADGATGTLNSDGSFNITTASGTTLSGSVDASTGQLAGTVAMPGSAPVEVGGVVDTVAAVRRLANASGRAQVGTGENVLIAGFILEGTEPKTVLIRAAGPALREHGITGTLAQPQLDLHQGAAVLVENKGWGTATNATQIAQVGTSIGAFDFAAASTDSAILTTLQPGAYTALVRGADGGSGVSLVEVYDVSGDSTRLINLSSRGYVGRDEQVLIAGVIVSGNTPKKLLLRAVGPALADFGVTGALANPRFKVYQGSTVVAENDDWAADTQVVAATAATGAFELASGSTDAALVITLAPGAYTVIVEGVDGATGVALVETYEVP